MVIKVRNNSGEVKKLVSYGNQNNSVLDRLCAFLLAISPILQHYRGLYENAGFTVLLLAFPILTIRFIPRNGIKSFSSRSVIAIIPLLIFEIYTAVDHTASFARLLYIGFMAWIFFCVAFGCVNVAYFTQYATNVVSAAAFLLIIQYIAYYIFHRTIDLRFLGMLVNRDAIWIRSLGISRAGRLYRPSAFFLEPSHLFIYSFPVLAIMLLSPNMTRWRRNKAILISSALILSTSGFGIAITIGLWGVYLLFHRDDIRKRKFVYKLLSPKTILVAIMLLLILIIIYFTVPFFQRSVNRIFLPTEGSSAIDGRVRLAKNYVKTISGRALFFGEENVTGELEFNLAGFFATYIKWGIVGIFLTYWFYGQGLFKLKNEYFWISFIIIVISYFTAHTHGTFYMLFYTIYLMEGYSQTGKKEYVGEAAET